MIPDFRQQARVLVDPTVRQTQVLQHLLDGKATYATLKEAIEELTKIAPPDADVVIQAFGITVVEVVFNEPHTLLFCGFDDNGNNTFVVAHYTQVAAKIVFIPKPDGSDKARVITGFSVSE